MADLHLGDPRAAGGLGSSVERNRLRGDRRQAWGPACFGASRPPPGAWDPGGRRCARRRRQVSKRITKLDSGGESIAARTPPRWWRPPRPVGASVLPCDLDLRHPTWRRIRADRSAHHPWSARRSCTVPQRCGAGGLGVDRGHSNVCRNSDPLAQRRPCGASARRPSQATGPRRRGGDRLAPRPSSGCPRAPAGGRARAADPTRTSGAAQSGLARRPQAACGAPLLGQLPG